MPERIKREEIVGKIERAQEKAPQKEGGVTFAEKWASPEEGAEELYALWRDYKRKRTELVEEYRKKRAEPKNEKESPADRVRRVRATVAADSKLAPLRTAMRARFQDAQVRSVFERNLEKEIETEEALHRKTIEVGVGEEKQEVSLWDHYLHERELKDKAEARRLELYIEIFSHRSKDPDELTLLELADLGARIKVSEREMQRVEREDSDLAARLSFERLRKYRDELKKGFIWTPSREKLADRVLEQMVIVNQNNPILLYGETGTGKTQLARALAKRLGVDLYEVGEEAKSDIRPLLGSLMQDKEGTYIIYGPFGQALTGKKTSRDKEAGPGGIFYMDEINGYPPDALRSLIKQLSGRRAGEAIGFAAWKGIKEKIAPGFALIGSANLPSEKHPDRQSLPVEVAREFAETNGAIEVDYPPQSTEDPEFYEMMLAAVMDQNDRIRAPKEELPPAWKEVVDTRTNTKRLELDTDPKAGGTLWRFASFIAEIQKSYRGEDNVLTPAERDASYLREAVLSPKVLVFLQEYKKSAMRSHESLRSFIKKKIDAWGSQKIHPEEDRNLIKKFQEEFQLA